MNVTYTSKIRQIAVLSLCGLWGAIAATPAAYAQDKAEITVLYDAFGKTSTMIKDWGFSAFIEYGGKRILFDTGNNAEIFARNVQAKGIDLTDLDFAIVSHRHGDHTSGLNYLMTVNPDVPIYVPKENFGVFGAALPGTFYKRDESLPPEMRYFDGNPPETLRFGSPWPEGNFTWITETTEVAPGFHLILLKGPWGVDLEVMEISLAIDTPDGIVLVVGCSHPTIEKVVEAATSVIDKPVHLVFGGTHLLPATPDDISRIATALRDNWKVEWIAPVHCTGEPAFAILKESFGDRYLYAGLGTTLELGPKVTMKAEAGQTPTYAMDLEDVVDYRVALAHQMLDALAHGRMRLASAQQ
jgi:7,8-dihydropterin-6-yl-methyl-4-(beta-D-ribofuranosyl)aminobenzene 5'-phosphate synthase